MECMAHSCIRIYYLSEIVLFSAVVTFDDEHDFAIPSRMKPFNLASAFIFLFLACLISAKVDNIIHEVRFAEVYRYFLTGLQV
jgi:hypothetical protein